MLDCLTITDYITYIKNVHIKKKLNKNVNLSQTTKNCIYLFFIPTDSILLGKKLKLKYR